MWLKTKKNILLNNFNQPLNGVNGDQYLFITRWTDVINIKSCTREFKKNFHFDQNIEDLLSHNQISQNDI